MANSNVNGLFLRKNLCMSLSCKSESQTLLKARFGAIAWFKDRHSQLQTNYLLFGCCKLVYFHYFLTTNHPFRKFLK